MAVFVQTLADLRATIRDIIDQASARLISDATITRFINLAQLEIVKFTEALITSENPDITASTAEYALPDDWLKTISVQYQIAPGTSDEFRFLEPLNRDDYLKLTTITSSSHPSHFALFGGNIIIYPTPTGTNDKYKHFYVEQPEQLVNDTDVPYNGNTRLSSYHEEIADLAVNLIRIRELDQASTAAFNAFIPRMQVMKAALNLKKRPGNARVKRKFTRGETRFPIVRFPPHF